MTTRFLLAAALSTLALAACAPQQARIASAAAPRPDWAFQASDIPVDPAYRFGKLANGMRYVIRRNATPKGTGVVRMEVEAGSLDESDAERGYAHFVEHMAFNGSTHVPEGEMVKLLQRDGLAFGADTNASTSFEQTLYMLDLPRADAKLLDTALMIMRETAGELTFAPAAVEREKGVVLAEMRDRNTWAYRNVVDQMGFAYPQARYPKRLPIGTTEALQGATADALKAFWKREYAPDKTTLIVVGDFDPAVVEAAIRARFGDWQQPGDGPQPGAGPVDFKDKGRTEIYLDPALSERVAALRTSNWQDEPDSVAVRREQLLRGIGYAIINRRLLRLTRQDDPPFRGAGFGSSDVFKAARTTQLIVDTTDGKWKRGLDAAVLEYRRALSYGFTPAEVAEQVAGLRTAARNAAASAGTRDHRALVDAVLALVRDDRVPATPESALDRLEAFVPEITPARVLAALQKEAVPLRDPLLRFTGKAAPVGGAKALRGAWNAAMKPAVTRTGEGTSGAFGYTDFGPAGAVVSNVVEPELGIREVRFANGVRLNLKKTDLEQGRILAQLSIDGGDMLATRADPLAVELFDSLPAGGLGKHSADELQTLLAGRTVGSGLSSTPETFVASANTTPTDLALQLQLWAAYVTDPAYRHEGETLYKLSINNFFAALRATPASALNSRLGGILSDDDPRFTLGKQADYQALTFANLKQTVADRLAHGAIEIGLVGDFDEAAAIAAVAKTFGALPVREADFRPYPEQRTRAFTADRSRRTLTHTGPADQAIVRLTWPTRDGEDPLAVQQLALLEAVVRIEVTDELREALGKAYSPVASSDLSRVWRGYGTFAIQASVATSEVDATRAAIRKVVADLIANPISADVLLRARAPMLEVLDNSLKSNRGWMTLVDRAQTEADRLDRQVKARARLAALTPADVQAAARAYLAPDAAVEVDVVPESAGKPAGG